MDPNHGADTEIFNFADFGKAGATQHHHEVDLSCDHILFMDCLEINCSAPSACRYFILVQQKEKWEEQEGRGQKEKEELNHQVQKNRLLQQENLQLKTEVDK